MKKTAQERKLLDKIYQGLNLKGKLSNKLDPQQKELFEIFSDIDEKSRMSLIAGLNNKSITKTLSSAREAYQKDNYLKAGLELISVVAILSKTFEYQSVIVEQMKNLKFEDLAKDKFEQQGGNLEDLRSSREYGMIKSAGLFDLVNSSKLYNLINKDRWKKLFSDKNPIISKTESIINSVDTDIKELLAIFDSLSTDLKKYDVMSYADNCKKSIDIIKKIQNKTQDFLDNYFKPFVKTVLPPVAAKQVETVIVKEKIKQEPVKPEIPLEVLSVHDLVNNLKLETKKVEEKAQEAEKAVESKPEAIEKPIEKVVEKQPEEQKPVDEILETVIQEPVAEKPKKDKKKNLDFLKTMNLKITDQPQEAKKPSKPIEPEEEDDEEVDLLADIESMMGITKKPEPAIEESIPESVEKPAEESVAPKEIKLVDGDLRASISRMISNFGVFKAEANGKDKKSDKYKAALDKLFASLSEELAQAIAIEPPAFKNTEELLNFRKLITFGIESSMNALIGPKNIPDNIKFNISIIKKNIDSKLEGLKKMSSYEDLFLITNSFIDSNELEKAASVIQKSLPKLNKKDPRYSTCIRLMFDLRK